MPEKTKSGFYLEGAPYWYDIGPLPDDIPFPIDSDYIGVNVPCPVDVYLRGAIARDIKLQRLKSYLIPPPVDYWFTASGVREIASFLFFSVVLLLFFDSLVLPLLWFLVCFLSLVFYLRLFNVFVYSFRFLRFSVASQDGRLFLSRFTLKNR